MRFVNNLLLGGILFLLMLGFLGCEKTPVDTIVNVTDVTLDQTTLVLTEGEEAILIAIVSPSNATNNEVIWITANAKVATVAEGIVTAVGVGETTITAKSDDGGKTSTCKVYVNQKNIPVTRVSLNKKQLELTEGEYYDLIATVSPDNASNKSLKWESDKATVATVDDAGRVAAVGEGTATITVSTLDGNKTATCTVTVKAKTYAVTGVSLDRISLTLTEGETAGLNATISPSNATNKSVSWTSNNTSVATVSSSGVVTAKKAGSATITVKTNDGNKTATCTVTVKAKTIPVTSVSLGSTSLTLTEGQSWQMSATVSPSNATNKNVTWASSNTAVATVSSKGSITAIAPGSATIKAQVGDVSATCDVVVISATVAVTGISINQPTLSMTVGESQTLSATVSPSNATNMAVNWTSSNSSVASVSQNGLVTANNVGTATITAKTYDGGFTAQCVVTVVPVPVSNVSLNKSSLTMMPGDEQTITATVSPDNAANKNVIWSSSDKDVASVAGGKIIALAEGIATITVTTEDGGFTATCKVTVTDDITRFVSASYLGGSMSFINDLIQYGSKLNFSVKNNSSQAIVVNYVQLIDGSTGSVGNKMTIDETIDAGGSQAWSITVGLAGVHSPTARFTYTYKGSQYTCDAKYTNTSWPF